MMKKYKNAWHKSYWFIPRQEVPMCVGSFNEFVNENKFGAVLRIFETKESGTLERAKMARKTFETLKTTGVFEKILFVVWIDKRYNSDCGKTAAILRDEFKDETTVDILEVNHGGLYCDCLNEGAVYLWEKGCGYALILSTEAEGYCNKKTINEMLYAFYSGALVTGAAMNETFESVLEGRICNAFSFWHIKSLILVGGFDTRNEIDDKNIYSNWKQGYNRESENFVWCPKSGVEEIEPLIKMIRKYGHPIIAPIIPFDYEGKRYETPNDSELRERNRKKFLYKLTRQISNAENLNADLSLIEGGVMPVYRHYSLVAQRQKD